MIQVLKEVTIAISEIRGFDSHAWQQLLDELEPDHRALLDCIVSSEAINEEIFNVVYGTSQKVNLLHKLMEVLVGENIISLENRARKDRYNVHVKYLYMNLLKDSNLSQAAIWFAESNIREAIRLELTSIVLDSARYLYRRYARRQNKRLSAKYGTLASQYEQLLHEELAIERLFQKIAIKQANNKAVRQELSKMEIPVYNPVYGLSLIHI